jgi:molybdopterin molybdotransferase
MSIISVREALEITLGNVTRMAPEDVLLLESRGRILAEDLTADTDIPPFTRATMDGYAVRSEDILQAPVTLEVAGYVPAGANPNFALKPKQAAKIMTGAPLPHNADAVQQLEKTQTLDDKTRVVILEVLSAGTNVAPQGSDARAGDKLASAGTYISPAAIGLLASAGADVVTVYGKPSVAILATGDELVEITSKPQSGQIRNSNSYTLHTQVVQVGAYANLLGIARDHKAYIKNRVAQGLRQDILLVTGGASVGDLDFVEDVFTELGFQILFNKVAIKPGKPMILARAEKTLIFGLPGNPVSSATVFEVFVRPAIRKMMGFPSYHNQTVSALLTQLFVNRSRRENYHPAVTWYEEGRFYCRPLMSRGSGDVTTYALSNSYLICPADRTEAHEGEPIDVMLRPDFFYH